MAIKRPLTRGSNSKVDKSGSFERHKMPALIEETYSEDSFNSEIEDAGPKNDIGSHKIQVNGYVRKQEGANVAGTSEKNEPVKRKRNAKKTFVYTPEFLANLPYGVKYAP